MDSCLLGIARKKHFSSKWFTEIQKLEIVLQCIKASSFFHLPISAFSVQW